MTKLESLTLEFQCWHTADVEQFIHMELKSLKLEFYRVNKEKKDLKKMKKKKKKIWIFSMWIFSFTSNYHHLQLES